MAVSAQGTALYLDKSHKIEFVAIALSLIEHVCVFSMEDNPVYE